MHAGADSAIDIVRAYDISDREGCLRLFESNEPFFFARTERAQFERFLDGEADACSYQVIERGGRIVACGGHVLHPDGCTVDLSWGMVARDLHGTGLGSLITAARLKAATAMPGVTRVRLDTSQHSQAFYRRFGFVVQQVVLDGYGPGLDRWDLELSL